MMHFETEGPLKTDSFTTFNFLTRKSNKYNAFFIFLFNEITVSEV